ncbi:MAG TPA: nuclear transport factor 2 family protein [Terriglobales bacterium]|nr:nuclear transport factor 2 family protein [Terriglobales bacterium]
MKNCRLLFTALLLSVPVISFAQDPSKVIAMENAWNQAELHNDAAAVELLLTDDFVMTVAEGTTLNKSQVLASVRDKSYNPDVLQSENMAVHMYSNTAIVTGDYREKGTEKGRPWSRQGRFTDMWIYSNGHWQCAASHFSVKPK